MKVHDVVIIGGGPAGGAAATQLTQQGVDVVVVEKEKRSHHKVCGEFISYETQYYFKKLGIDLHSYGAQTIDRLRLIRGHRTIDKTLGFQALSLSRQCLDEAVLLKAQSSGAEIKYDVTVTGMVKDLSHWVITCQEREPLFAKTVFLATGKHDLRGWSQRKGRENNYIGFKMHFQLSPAQQEKIAHHVELMLFQGGYVGLEPIEHGTANLCLVVTKAQFAACGKNWDSLLHDLMRKIPTLAARLGGALARWPRPLTIFGIPYGFVYTASSQDPASLFRLGDQMAVIPSLCGDGLAIALHTGFLAAKCYAKTDAYDYHRRSRQLLVKQIGYATTVSRLLASPLFQPFILPICCVLPKLIAASIKYTRTKIVTD